MLSTCSIADVNSDEDHDSYKDGKDGGTSITVIEKGTCMLVFLRCSHDYIVWMLGKIYV